MNPEDFFETPSTQGLAVDSCQGSPPDLDPQRLQDLEHSQSSAPCSAPCPPPPKVRDVFQHITISHTVEDQRSFVAQHAGFRAVPELFLKQSRLAGYEQVEAFFRAPF